MSLKEETISKYIYYLISKLREAQLILLRNISQVLSLAFSKRIFNFSSLHNIMLCFLNSLTIEAFKFCELQLHIDIGFLLVNQTLSIEN